MEHLMLRHAYILTVTFLLMATITLSAGHFKDPYRPGSFLFMTSRYMYVNTRLSWHEAMNNCKRHGGNLVSIETKGENDHLLRILRRYPNHPCWTGGNDISSEGRWRWVADHRMIGYTNWNAGEPNNSGGVEDCLYIANYNRWNDNPCGMRFPSLCEKATSLAEEHCKK